MIRTLAGSLTAAGLSDDCRSGEGEIDVQRARNGTTGTFPITLQAGRVDAWRDHYALGAASDGTAG